MNYLIQATNFIKKNYLIILVLALGFILRYHNYASFPVYGESQDENAWTWMGTSLIGGGHPTSWSSTGVFGYWDEREIYIGGSLYRIVTPYLDNPHLFSLVPGFFAYIKGYTQVEMVPSTIIRFPMIFLGTLNILLLYVAAKKWFDHRLAIMSATLYATIPTMVFSSRLVMAENLLITWMLISWIILHSLFRSPSNKKTILLGIVGGLSGLTKVAGLVVLAANTLLILKRKLNKQATKSLLIGLAIFCIYPLYGLLANKQLFLSVLTKQSQSNIGFSTILSTFMTPQIVQKTLVDGWVYLGLVAILILLLGSKKQSRGEQLISIYSLIWIGFLITATGEVSSHGWYRYPLFPLMAIAITQLFIHTKRYAGSFIGLYILVWLPTIRLILLSIDKTINPRPLIFLGFTPLLFSLFGVKQVTQKKILYGFLTLMIITNIVLPFVFNHDVYWKDSLYFYPIRTGE